MEKRTLTVTNILTKRGHWPGLKQGFRLVRERTVASQKTIETHYGVTSLTPEQASPTKLLQLARNHWTIENKLHYVRDVSMDEDHCRCRVGNSAQVLAAIRNLVLYLSKKARGGYFPEAREYFAAQPQSALELLMPGSFT